MVDDYNKFNALRKLCYVIVGTTPYSVLDNNNKIQHKTEHEK